MSEIWKYKNIVKVTRLNSKTTYLKRLSAMCILSSHRWKSFSFQQRPGERGTILSHNTKVITNYNSDRAHWNHPYPQLTIRKWRIVYGSQSNAGQNLTQCVRRPCLIQTPTPGAPVLTGSWQQRLIPEWACASTQTPLTGCCRWSTCQWKTSETSTLLETLWPTAKSCMAMW